MESKKSAPTSIGFEYASNAKLFCDRLCLYLYIGIWKVGPTTEFTPPPPNFMRMCAIGEQVKVTKFSTTTSLVVEAIALVFLNIFFFSTVILNAVAVMTIWKSRFLKEKICNFIVLIQSAMDLLNGASSATPRSVCCSTCNRISTDSWLFSFL